MLKNSCNYRTKFKWINASSNFAISVHIDQDWDSNPEELIFVNFHEVTLFFNNEFAERVGFEPTGRQRRPPDFKSGTINQLCHLSKIDTLGLHSTTLPPPQNILNSLSWVEGIRTLGPTPFVLCRPTIASLFVN